MKNLKKRIMSLVMSAFMTLNLVACQSENNNLESEKASNSVSTNVYNTEDYSLVYLDGKFHLVTSKIYNTSELYHRTYRKLADFYEANTGELVGTMTRPVPGDKTDDGNWFTYDALNDESKYFDGEYGYGKWIPRYAVIPVSEVISNSSFTQEEFDFLSSNSEELKEKIIFNEGKIVDHIEIIDLTVAMSAKCHEETVALTKYVCETKIGNKNVLLGYRCSYNNSDIGYNYVYDILTGNIVYIGSNKENCYKSVTESTYDNGENKSLATLIAEAKNGQLADKEEQVQVDEETLSIDEKTSDKEIEQEKNSNIQEELEEKYEIDDLEVMTINSEEGSQRFIVKQKIDVIKDPIVDYNVFGQYGEQIKQLEAECYGYYHEYFGVVERKNIASQKWIHFYKTLENGEAETFGLIDEITGEIVNNTSGYWSSEDIEFFQFGDRYKIKFETLGGALISEGIDFSYGCEYSFAEIEELQNKLNNKKEEKRISLK